MMLIQVIVYKCQEIRRFINNIWLLLAELRDYIIEEYIDHTYLMSMPSFMYNILFI